jgi:aminoglycoside phosphotransferase (APT) family kinase protein
MDGVGLPPIRPVLESAIGGCDLLTGDLKKRVRSVLDSLEEGDTLCHLDFHPDQVMLTSKGPVVIDWMTAVKGDPLADLARTLVITKFGYPPNTNWIMSRLIDIMRDQMRSAYLTEYRALRPDVDLDPLLRWTIPIAAARLADGIPEEQEPLMKYLLTILGQVENTAWLAQT